MCLYPLTKRPSGQVYRATPMETYVRVEVKLPGYIDLLNINLDNHDLAEAKRRIGPFTDAFRKD